MLLPVKTHGERGVDVAVRVDDPSPGRHDGVLGVGFALAPAAKIA